MHKTYTLTLISKNADVDKVSYNDILTVLAEKFKDLAISWNLSTYE